jgi:hypothetical protein
MSAEILDLSYGELLALLAGDPGPRTRLSAGERLRAVTPFRYPGRDEPLIVYLGSVTAPEAVPPAGAAVSATVPPAGLVRVSDGGDLIKCLSEHGMELEVDMILSKTVFHAVRQQEGAGITGGQVYLDCKAEALSAGVWHFLQLAAEIMGLRHAKYKDALTQFERRRDADVGMTGWWEGKTQR